MDDAENDFPTCADAIRDGWDVGYLPDRTRVTRRNLALAAYFVPRMPGHVPLYLFCALHAQPYISMYCALTSHRWPGCAAGDIERLVQHELEEISLRGHKFDEIVVLDNAAHKQTSARASPWPASLNDTNGL
jgi:hypothetical protein